MVCEPRGEVCVERLATQKQSVEDGAVERVDRELEVDVRADLPALSAALEGGEHRFAPSRDDVTMEAFGEIQIVLDVGDEAGDDVAAGRLSEDGDQPAEERSEVVPRRFASGGRRDDIGAREIRLEHERRPRGPPAVDRLLADARPRGDGLDGHSRVPELDEQLPGRRDDRLMRALAAAAAALASRTAGRIHVRNDII